MPAFPGLRRPASGLRSRTLPRIPPSAPSGLRACTDDQSRNRRFGLALARGLGPDAACAEIGQAVEGLRTTHAARLLAEAHGVDMPIVAQVDGVLHDGLDPRRAVRALLERDPKEEVPHGP
ncbi:MAG: NAD(P)H-dependent glycerol-3-phosphate dehydrogenase [Halofilum sp. (in: g-proteobacteria)]|nr:NAD(P)H-dependent glycerol-3-phosphate dehydrogenase [Halofilum sp. (in: g-proteobacteria)]